LGPDDGDEIGGLCESQDVDSEIDVVFHAVLAVIVDVVFHVIFVVETLVVEEVLSFFIEIPPGVSVGESGVHERVDGETISVVDVAPGEVSCDGLEDTDGSVGDAHHLGSDDVFILGSGGLLHDGVFGVFVGEGHGGGQICSEIDEENHNGFETQGDSGGDEEQEGDDFGDV